MDEENQKSESPEAVDPVEKPQEVNPPETNQQTPPTFDWLQEVDKVDSKELRKHPKVAGIIGGEIQKAIQLERNRIKEEEGAKAAREAEEALRELAQQDPKTFAEYWLSEDQKREIQRQLDEVNSKARSDVATAVGRAMQSLPEWAGLSQEDFEVLAKAMSNKKDDEAIPAFNHAVVDLIANRRAKVLFEQWKGKDQVKDREALRQEEAAKLMQGGESPDITPPKGLPKGIDFSKMNDKDFDSFWKTHFK